MSGEQCEKIYKWLSSTIPSSNYSEALERHFKHTGAWFFDTIAFAQWKQTGGSFLWIHGIRKCFMKCLLSGVAEQTVQLSVEKLF
jgi:hypothetical protein